MFLTLAFFGVCGGQGMFPSLALILKSVCSFGTGSGLKHFSWLRSKNQGVFLLLALISGPRWVLWLFSLQYSGVGIGFSMESHSYLSKCILVAVFLFLFLFLLQFSFPFCW